MADKIQWLEFEDGSSLGTTGTDGGTIIKDLEGPDARITLEKDSVLGAYSITCGLYGMMVHSFAIPDNAPEVTFKEVQNDLEQVIELWPETDASQDIRNAFYVAIEEFVTKTNAL